MLSFEVLDGAYMALKGSQGGDREQEHMLLSLDVTHGLSETRAPLPKHGAFAVS